MIRSLTIVALTLLIAGCNSKQAEQATPDVSVSARIQTLVGGDEDIILHPDKVEAYRIESHEQEKRISEAVLLTEEQTNALAALFLTDESYAWGPDKGCAPIPGVLLVFTQGDQTVEARLCYECGIVNYTPGEGEDFGPMYHEMVAWVKTIFPDDPVVQGL